LGRFADTRVIVHDMRREAEWEDKPCQIEGWVLAKKQILEYEDGNHAVEQVGGEPEKWTGKIRQ